MKRRTPRRTLQWFNRLVQIAGLVSAVGLAAIGRLPAEGPKTSSSPATQPAEVYAAWPFDANEALRRQVDTAKALGIKKEVVIDPGHIRMRFILIPAGKFMMGSPGSQHEVIIPKPYYLGACKVTRNQYWQVTGINPSLVANGFYPINAITGPDAEEFCRTASKRTGKSIRLPTEAEWENACRAGANTTYFWGDDVKLLGDYAWFHDNAGFEIHSVGLKKPNAFGLFDINGLLWETCRVNAADPNSDATPSAKDYINRGATYGSRPPMFVLGVRIGASEDRTPGKGLDHFGFRAAMDVE